MVEKQIIDKLLDTLPEFYNKDDGTNVYGFMLSLAQELDDFDDAIAKLQEDIFVSTAKNEYLDDLADMFRLTRKSSETDAELRTRILSYWQTFAGGGTEESIKTIVSNVTGQNTEDVDLTDIADLKFRLSFSLTTIDSIASLSTLRDEIYRGKAAGVYPLYSITVILDAENGLGESFGFSDSTVITQIFVDPFIIEDSLIESKYTLG